MKCPHRTSTILMTVLPCVQCWFWQRSTRLAFTQCSPSEWFSYIEEESICTLEGGENRFWPRSKWWCWEGCQREPSLHMLIWQMRTRKLGWALPGALLPTAASQTPASLQGHLPQVKAGTLVLFEGFVVETFGKVKSKEKNLWYLNLEFVKIQEAKNKQRQASCVGLEKHGKGKNTHYLGGPQSQVVKVQRKTHFA